MRTISGGRDRAFSPVILKNRLVITTISTFSNTTVTFRKIHLKKIKTTCHVFYFIFNRRFYSKPIAKLSANSTQSA